MPRANVVGPLPHQACTWPGRNVSFDPAKACEAILECYHLMIKIPNLTGAENSNNTRTLLMFA